MEARAEVVIVGGGVIGLCTAYALHQRGRHVLVVDRGAMGQGCSSGNAGFVSPSHVVPLASPGVIAQGLRWMLDRTSPFYIKPRLSADLAGWLWKFRGACTPANVERAVPLLRDLSLASAALYRDLEATAGLDFGLQATGLLMLHRTDKGRAANLELAAHAEAAGLDVEHVDATGVEALEPRLAGRDDLAGVYYRQDAALDPGRLMQALRDRLTTAGVALLPDTAVYGFVHDGQRITALESAGGFIYADEVVLAAGAWTPGLAAQLGLKVPVQAAKGYSVTLTPAGGPFRLPLLLTEAKVAVTPMAGRLRLAGTLELAGLDPTVDTARVQAILDAAQAYLPDLDLAGIDPAEAWHGFRPCTPDGLPLIGRAPRFRNLTVATGHAMMGITLAPATAHLIADILHDEPSAIDRTALRVDRFA